MEHTWSEEHALTGRVPTPREVTVVVPTYRRPDSLVQCLAGLQAQNCNPSKVIVVKRDGDELTESCLAGPLPLNPFVVSVRQGGQMAAMAGGLAASGTPLVAFTDDDAVPRPDWIERLIEPFSNAEIGAVGGRDVVASDNLETESVASEELVGVVTKWGRLIGNHHIGIGPARYVDVLKGVNCMYRRAAVAIPSNLRGSGAQVHNEVAIGLRARSNGWQLLYDPQIIVDHYPAPRFDLDARSGPAKSAVYDAAYNLTLSIGAQGFAAALRRLLYGLLIGDRALPGLGRTVIGLLDGRERHGFMERLGPAFSGNAAAGLDLARGGGLNFY
jgi:cellulose synthase/poly-beta-1,6-N-acetylglucosamine synthase-like glycosyltransferase